MSEFNNCGSKATGEFVLGSLNDDDDSEEEMDDEIEGVGVGDYEDKALKEISVIKAEVEKIFDNVVKDPLDEKNSFKNHAEHLLQIIIKLDNIDPKNNDKIREARKGSILYTQDCLHVIDTKLKSVSNDGEK